MVTPQSEAAQLSIPIGGTEEQGKVFVFPHWLQSSQRYQVVGCDQQFDIAGLLHSFFNAMGER